MVEFGEVRDELERGVLGFSSRWVGSISGGWVLIFYFNWVCHIIYLLVNENK